MAEGHGGSPPARRLRESACAPHTARAKPRMSIKHIHTHAHAVALGEHVGGRAFEQGGCGRLAMRPSLYGAHPSPRACVCMCVRTWWQQWWCCSGRSAAASMRGNGGPHTRLRLCHSDGWSACSRVSRRTTAVSSHCAVCTIGVGWRAWAVRRTRVGSAVSVWLGRGGVAWCLSALPPYHHIV